MARIPDDELEDFQAAARDIGLDPAEFEITAEESQATNPGFIQRVIRVKRGSVRANYDGGPGTNWVMTAVVDLKRKVFGD